MPGHALQRTSPKGQAFIGTCFKCGTPNLTASAVLDECPNQRGLTADQALIEAIEGPKGVYGEMCRDPKLCAGKGYCPRDPTCID